MAWMKAIFSTVNIERSEEREEEEGEERKKRKKARRQGREGKEGRGDVYLFILSFSNCTYRVLVGRNSIWSVERLGNVFSTCYSKLFLQVGLPLILSFIIHSFLSPFSLLLSLCVWHRLIFAVVG